ncbi:MAG: hypothetical protein NTX35_12000 [Verrucomicrobia bacterium]|nr:hypothetical protein [Verrucomicrobiota bacterium]
MTLNIADRWSKSHKLNRFRTALYASLRPCPSPRVAFIFGCQRSGTTLLRDFIGLDHRFRDIGEGDPPYFHQEAGERYLRLVEDSEVEALVKQQSSQWVLLKPLHDSQRAVELLERFDNSRGIWIFRHYDSVVQSHLGYYQHDPMDYLEPLRRVHINSWMLSGLEHQSLEHIRHLLSLADTSIPDLYAIFWYARNALLFQHLKRANLLVVSYESLVATPHQCLQAFNKHLGVGLSTKALLVPMQRRPNAPALSKLTPEVEHACNLMLQKLSFLSNQSKTP